MSAQEAARAARRQFGNVTVLKERQRAQRGILSPTEWWRDVRFGMRMLVKRPASSAAVVLALALGIGLNSAVFTFVNALLLRPPQGVSGTNRLVEVWLHDPKGRGVTGYLPFNYPDYTYYRDHTKSLEGLMAFDGRRHGRDLEPRGHWRDSARPTCVRESVFAAGCECGGGAHALSG